MRVIEIKNKRMILFREDRLIGAKGDVDTSQRKFILDAVQGETDLSKMVAWIKIDPKVPGESPYDQLLKKEIFGDKLVLTWRLTAKNLERAGEISAQIIFASPDYFIEDELDKILGDSLILPSPVEGKSAPVWQTYSETFVIEESIDDTVGYRELTKNVLVSAVAEALSSAESAQDAAESAQESANSAQKAADNAYLWADEAHYSELAAVAIAQELEGDFNEVKVAHQEVLENLDASRECLQSAEYACDKAQEYMTLSEQSSERAEQNAQKVLSAVKKARDFRLIYTKTLTAEDTDCYSFEITADAEGNPFSLSEFTIYAHIPVMPDYKSAYLQVRVQPDNEVENGARKYGIVTQFIGIDKTKDSYQRIECANRGRWRANLVRGNAWNQNGDVVYHTGAVCSTSRFTDGKNATAIVFCGTSSVGVPFPEGTMIEIWGVDSIKEAE